MRKAHLTFAPALAARFIGGAVLRARTVTEGARLVAQIRNFLYAPFRRVHKRKRHFALDIFARGVALNGSVSAEALEDTDVTIRTTLLLDISASMPKSMRDSILDYLNNYIETINSNEQLRIITFGEEITVLQDFTSDRYDLSKAVSGIKFEGQQSMIYDAVYNTMPRIGTNNDAPCYYRTIVITDGADESLSGITKEELYLKLQESFYPVEVLAISDSENDPVEKNLTALSRISGGRCITMCPGIDITSLDFRLENIIWIRVKIPETVLDGSTRQFNIKDESNTLQFDFKVPIFTSETMEQIEEASEENELLIVVRRLRISLVSQC